MEGPAQPVPHVGASALVRFGSELGMLVAFGFVGALIVDGVAASVTLAVLLPALAALTWGAWVAPRARWRRPDPARLAVELILFAAAGAGLVLVGHWPSAMAVFALYAFGFPHRRAESAALAAGWTP